MTTTTTNAHPLDSVDVTAELRSALGHEGFLAYHDALATLRRMTNRITGCVVERAIDGNFDAIATLNLVSALDRVAGCITGAYARARVAREVAISLGRLLAEHEGAARAEDVGDAIAAALPRA